MAVPHEALSQIIHLSCNHETQTDQEPMKPEPNLMKNKLIILSSIAVVLVAAVFIFSIGYFQHSQRQLNKGLWTACKTNNAAAASYWLAKGADVNAIDQHGAVGLPGRTALHMCAHFGNTETIDLLLQVGAEVDATDKNGRTPLFFTNFAQAAKSMVRHGASLEHKDDNGETALEARVANGWHVDDDLRAVLTNPSSTKETEREPFVTNLDNQGTAWVWDIEFNVAETNGRAAGSAFNGMLGESAHSERTDGTMKITLGEVIIDLEKKPSRPATLKVNGSPYGTVEPNDQVSIDAQRNVSVNGTVRVAGDAP